MVRRMLFFPIIIVIVDCLAVVYGQVKSLGSTEYCAELKPQTNLTIPELTGRWFGAEMITHRETIYGDGVASDCIQIYITEINEEMVTKRPRQFVDMPENLDPIGSSQPLTTRPPQPPPIQEQPRPKYEPPPQRGYDQNVNDYDFNERNFAYNDSTTMFPLPALSQVSFNNSPAYEHLRIEWTEAETKWEYIARYNRLQNGLWMASAPQQYRSPELPNFKVHAGTIEVIAFHKNYLVLKFCEIIPRQQLFTIILARESNTIPLHVIREIRHKLIGFNLPTVYRRRVCNGGIAVSHNLITTFLVASIAWLKLIW